MQTLIAPQSGAQSRFSFSRAAFLMAGLLLGLASLALAVRYGWSRGSDDLTRPIWAAVGLAAGLAALVTPGEALAALRARQWPRVALSALLFTASASWTVAGALGSAAAGRALASRTETHADTHHDRLARDHDRLSTELTGIPAGRSAEEAAAEAAAIYSRTPGLTECRDHDPNWRPTRAHRKACIEIGALEVERARAERRATIDKRLAEVATELANAKPVAPANADATTLAHFARAFGLTITDAQMGDLLTVAAVVVVDLAGGLALALGRSVPSNVPEVLQMPRSARRSAAREDRPKRRVPEVPEARNSGSGTSSVGRARAPVLRLVCPASSVSQLARVKAEIVKHAQSGTLPASQRAICDVVGASKGTIGLAIAQLLADGELVGQVGRAGTLLLPARKSA